MTTLDELLRGASGLLLDFDGPICNVFAEHPASTLAHRMHDHLASLGWTIDRSERTDSPHVTWAGTAGAPEHVVRSTEAMLYDAEVEAVETATPAPGVIALLRERKAAGRPVAIVSNNATAAIERYLDLHDVRHLIGHIEGRDRRDPQLMKPNPRSLHRALAAIDIGPRDAIFVGDTISDAEAAQAANVRFIGYAQRDDKRLRFAGIGITDIISGWPHRSIAS